MLSKAQLRNIVVAVVVSVITGGIAWAWNTNAELAGLKAESDAHWTEVSRRLNSIETKLDKALED